MKKATASLLVILLIVSIMVSGCGVTLRSSGNPKTEDYSFDKFSRVEISNAFDFEITRADTYSIKITADDNLFENIQVAKDGETLRIDLKTFSILGPVTLKAVITMPQLTGLNASGAARGTVSGFRTTDDTEITVSGASRVALAQIALSDASFEVSGASDISGDLTAKKISMNISGASEVEVNGSASDITAEVSGASRANLPNFKVNNANIELSGASTGTVNLSGRLDAEITGASKLYYTGAPTMGNIETSGASTLSKQ